MPEKALLQYTGERIVPEADNCEPNFAVRMYQEHIARYLFAAQLCSQKTVVDVGCGIGYGSRRLAMLGAREVTAFDLSDDAINHAKTYYAHPRVNFHVDNAEDFTIPAAVDVAVCFELIEHVNKPQQVLRRIARALKPDGLLIMSTPRALEKKRTHFHTHEFSFGEFEDLILGEFEHVKFYFENNHFASIITDRAPSSVDSIECLKDQFTSGRADVFMVVAARSGATPIQSLKPVAVLNDDSYVTMLERDVEILHKAENDLREATEFYARESAEKIAFHEAEVSRIAALYTEVAAKAEEQGAALFNAHQDLAKAKEIAEKAAFYEAEVSRITTLYKELFTKAEELDAALCHAREEGARIEAEAAACREQLEKVETKAADTQVRLVDADSRRLAAYEFARSLNEEARMARVELARLRNGISTALVRPEVFLGGGLLADHRHRSIVEAMAAMVPGVEATRHLQWDALVEQVAKLVVDRNQILDQREYVAGQAHLIRESKDAVIAERDALIAERESLRAEHRRLYETAAHAEHAVKAMRHSTSWTLTAPVRGVRRVARAPVVVVLYWRKHGVRSTLRLIKSRLFLRK